MFFFGVNKKTISKGNWDGVCGNCNKGDGFFYRITSDWFHLFFVPTFPLGNLTELVCKNCKVKFTELKLEIDKETIATIKEKNNVNTKTPKWQWTGLILGVILIGLIIFSVKSTNKEIKAKIENPKIADIYELQTGPYTFTILRLDSIINNEFVFKRHNFTTTKRSGLSKLMEYKENIWSFKDTTITKFGLDSLFEADKLFEIHRTD